jgi:hypothetical protein
MLSEEARQKRLAAYRKRYREDTEFRERRKAAAKTTSKERYAKDKSSWIRAAAKKKQRMAADKDYRDKVRASLALAAVRRYAADEDVRARHSLAYKKWATRNADHRRKYNRQYKTRRLKEDVAFWLKHAIRSRLNVALRRKYADGSAVRDLGCSIEHFIVHIESQFQPGMAWGNRGRGGWHIDHIIPLCAFDLMDEKQRRAACHYSNMQPLWEAENLKKKARLPDNAAAILATLSARTRAKAAPKASRRTKAMRKP